MTARGGIYGDFFGDGRKVSPPPPCKHRWSVWGLVGYTGDWFRPRIMKRTCSLCGKSQTEEF